MSNIRPGGSFNEFHNERYLPDSYAKEYKDYLLNDGDLIIAMTDMATETKILGLPTLVNNTSGRSFLLNQRVGKLCKFSKDIYVPYLRHILTAKDVIDYYKSKGAGGLQINISKKDILSVKFPLPAIPTQQKIVAKLDAIFTEIDVAKAAAEAKAKNLIVLKQSFLVKAFSMNEADTRAQLIDKKLVASGWEIGEARILREYYINAGEIKVGGIRDKKLKADYVLVYKNRKLAIIEAKSDELEVGEGVAQAKSYATKLKLDYTYAANGREIYEIVLKTGIENEQLVSRFPTPDELWERTFGEVNEWQARFNAVPFENVYADAQQRYYQEIAVNRVMEAIAGNKNRVLLTLATGTGKTFIAFQIAWKLFKSKWTLQKDAKRTPRILFLADRNILANQAKLDFGSFNDDALV
eukprot:gene12159-25514_t